jgi:hypothetical protein
VIPEAPRHGLARLATHLGLDGAGTHRAAQDAERTRAVFLACAARLGADATMASLGASRRFEDGARATRQGPRALRRALRESARVRLDLRGAVAVEGVLTGAFARRGERAIDLREGAVLHTLPWSSVASLRRVR